MQNKAERLIGLATRAGKIITGIELCEKAVKTNKAKLIILARDISESSKKVFIGSGVDTIYVDSKEKLGKCTGKEVRSVAVITDSDFSDAVLKAYLNNDM
ncbi:MAG: ribosomal L7Ae/L30e/S12e/Gadd45 family protein [Clostridia bacterium]|nr:ribosomal L7Ae/L30e/S12e/Gadd45 family protein [Clostridia bacterium]